LDRLYVASRGDHIGGLCCSCKRLLVIRLKDHWVVWKTGQLFDRTDTADLSLKMFDVRADGSEGRIKNTESVSGRPHLFAIAKKVKLARFDLEDLKQPSRAKYERRDPFRVDRNGVVDGV